MVTPLLKKSFLDPTDPANYHLVLNPVFLGKIIESTVAEQLQSLLEEMSALDPFQFGFHLGYGTEKALVALTDCL